MSNKIILGHNQYGKAEVRVVKITRDTDRHEIEDLNVTSQLRGDFAAAHLEGDNSHVVATDTQKNTIYAFARDGVGSPEAFLLRLGEHFTSSFDWVTGGRWEAESYSWDRIQAHGAGHDHSFVRNGQEVRTAVLVRDGGTEHLISGLKDLTVLKSTQSGLQSASRGTSTPPSRKPPTASSPRTFRPAGASGPEPISARWTSTRATRTSRACCSRDSRENYSHALQQTLFDMGTKVLEAHSEIDEIKFSMPNKHHFLVDLSPFGLDNPNEVFFAADRPYGLIEATVQRDDASPADIAWSGIAGFC